jgi:hypothetical protein
MRLTIIILITILLTSCSILKKKNEVIHLPILKVPDINLDSVSDYVYLDVTKEHENSFIVNNSYNLFKIDESINKSIKGEELKIIEVSNNKVSTSTTTGGHVAYKIPNDMTVRSTYQVIVRISKSTAHIFENLNGEVKTSSIPITETMEVKVIDPSPSDSKMFDIILDNAPIQLVENNEHVTQWTFNVTPIRVGKSKLKIVISTITNGHTKEVVYEDEVNVKIDITKTIPFFIATYWQWLLTTLVIPVIIWFFKRKKNKDEGVH